ncbi:DEAD/DEAH box helicase [Lentzea sp. CC55]|uniref:DEAD/DEAH box helicase n=1 Tax=Lentzea sp. CC55 TaxID=2884909 RepID=UPI001F25F8BF|nr:DEAD/DEAH box helicase [Lentzea sp. CC55]MCG8923202.1 DEAD/DEAH box helicase [Lentzea sp. CC55]
MTANVGREDGQDVGALEVEMAQEMPEHAARYAPGAQVRIRDEQWLVRKVSSTRHDGWMLEVTGVSPFVRGTDAVFYEKLEELEKRAGIEVLDPRKTRLVADDSPNHRRARLYLEAAIRKTALPQTEHGLALADSFLMDKQTHQLRPAELALSMQNPQPRILIADVVGLGKTLEIGLLLAELIRRGRGERILVVTPAHVLEQFQRELWTRFSIPLVRLDSTGIQRIQQDIPAGRNPFAYFKRAIISVDTLKSDVYAHHLGNTDWDAVVIDESHNLVNRGTRNNALAQLLARRTDALILASATPHNGNAESFAELIKLLDEAAIANPSNYDVKNLEHLYIRRTKTSREVRDSLKGAWADRGPSLPVEAKATDKEEAIFEELASRWIPRDRAAGSVSDHQLFPYTLFKAFLSSHKALRETIGTRLRTLASAKATSEIERSALLDLDRLASRIEDADSAKLTKLVEVLNELGVGPKSTTRVVIFSERIATLKWLAEVVPAQLGFPAGKSDDKNKPWLSYGGVVQVIHSEATGEDEQKRIVEKFGLRDDPVRILVTNDVASEGVNLHQQCNQLIHYDLPWSLIRIEQRNGRIDRYGQERSPEFRALVLTSDVQWRVDEETGEVLSLDDRLVGAKLLRREEEAHKIEGSAEAVTGLYRAKEEDDRLTKDLIAGRTVETSIKKSRQGSAGFLATMLGNVGADPDHAEVAIATVPSVFESTAAYFDEALRQICPTRPEDDLSLRRDEDGTIAFEPPADLQYRFKALPKSYLDEQGILPTSARPGRLLMTFSKQLAEKRLKAARDSSKTLWPNVSYVSDVHPVLDWVTDKALASIRYDEAFVLAYLPHERLTGPVFLVQGIYSNALGRPAVVEWMAVLGLPDTPRVVPMDAEFLELCGVGPRMPGRATPQDRDGLQRLVPQAIDEAERCLVQRENEYAQRIDRVLEPYSRRVQEWRDQAVLFAAGKTGEQGVNLAASRREGLIASLKTSGAPMLRLLAVLEPLSDAEGTAR